MRPDYIAVPVRLIENMCKALSEYELTDGDWKDCFDKIHDACVDIDAFCRDKLHEKESERMTREEAIKELSYIADEMPSMECANWIEAISMAINALKQELCTDAISRESVKNIIRGGVCTDTEADIEYVCGLVDDLPSVNPAEKVGYWEYRNIANSTIAGYWCDNCHVGSSRAYNYCPNCGAKMQEVEE